MSQAGLAPLRQSADEMHSTHRPVWHTPVAHGVPLLAFLTLHALAVVQNAVLQGSLLEQCESCEHATHFPGSMQ